MIDQAASNQLVSPVLVKATNKVSPRVGHPLASDARVDATKAVAKVVATIAVEVAEAEADVTRGGETTAARRR